MMKTSNGKGSVSVLVLCSVFVLSITVVFIVNSVDFVSLIQFTTGSKSEHKIQAIELQTTAITTALRGFRAASFAADSHSPNVTVIASNNSALPHRKDQKLEQGLARARAAIRKAASRSSQNLSAIRRIVSAEIFRNPAHFITIQRLGRLLIVRLGSLLIHAWCAQCALTHCSLHSSYGGEIKSHANGMVLIATPALNSEKTGMPFNLNRKQLD
ncbi:unnamed protein product [Ilex paraguariensis]|uniref:Uncharacterized protein n=1 Tax=Ilex paraguariensis TaxID=185542 RepID=A0ABC8TLR5_9AQUA